MHASLSPAISRHPDSYVLCPAAGLFDEPDSRRFFISMMYYTCTTPDCANKPVFSYVLLAVSKSDNPLDGFLGPYYVDTTGLNPVTFQVGLGARDTPTA